VVLAIGHALRTHEALGRPDTTIRLSSSWVPLNLPPPRAARLFYLDRDGPMLQGVSCVHHETASLYVSNKLPIGI
jgi:hypothetical protein